MNLDLTIMYVFPISRSPKHGYEKAPTESAYNHPWLLGWLRVEPLLDCLISLLYFGDEWKHLGFLHSRSEDPEAQSYI
jgi:hypothetical protein